MSRRRLRTSVLVTNKSYSIFHHPLAVYMSVLSPSRIVSSIKKGVIKYDCIVPEYQFMVHDFVKRGGCKAIRCSELV